MNGKTYMVVMCYSLEKAPEPQPRPALLAQGIRKNTRPIAR